MSIINRRNFLYLLSSTTFVLTGRISATASSPPSWDSIRKIDMKGNLKAFWDVSTNVQDNQQQAIQHGFKLATTPNTAADYPGKQKENIFFFLEKNHQNPWVKPPFFEKTVKNNIRNQKTNYGSIFVHDLEPTLDKNIQKLWLDSELKKSSKATNFEDFSEKYYRELATWFSLPCQWSKEIYPQQPVGIYGPQIFSRDYWRFLRPSELRQAHSSDLRLWKYIDPYVDFYTNSIYIFYDLPDSIYYLAANVEENYRLSQNYSNKPLYAYLWLRYHPSNKKAANQELPAYLVEAMAVIPFFTGAKGFVLWGWEPKSKGQPYHNLPTFMDSLGRVADLSAKISRAKLIIDRPADELWREKAPLIRKLKVSKSEWIIMAVYPWQNDDDQKIVTVDCGNRSVDLKIFGKRTEIYHLRGSNLKRILMMPVG